MKSGSFIIQKLKLENVITLIVVTSLFCACGSIDKESEATQHQDVGDSYYHFGNYKEAVEEYKECLYYDPERATAYWSIGVCYRNLGRFAEAMAAHDKSVEIDPDEAKFRTDRSITLHLWNQRGGVSAEYLPELAAESLAGK
ncbi:MAG: tetratricopeptide repeat protein [Planctomycetes bacterium]|nr:tetratricopeptide repeat protein [Planctomycetota bacterium]